MRYTVGCRMCDCLVNNWLGIELIDYLCDRSYQMATGNEEAADKTSLVEQEGIQLGPHRQSPMVGEGSTRSSEPLTLADLGHLLAQVLATSRNKNTKCYRTSCIRYNHHRRELSKVSDEKKSKGRKRSNNMMGSTSQGPSKSTRPNKKLKISGCFNCG